MAAAHASAPRTYLVIFGSLLVLTAATVGASRIDLGGWNAPVAILIAAGKATLIVLFFMHALEGSRLVWMVILGALLFLGVMLSFTFADYGTRRRDEGIRNPPARVMDISPP